MVKKKLWLILALIAFVTLILSILKTGKAKGIRFNTLASICKELDCQPGDLLEYVYNEE